MKRYINLVFIIILGCLMTGCKKAPINEKIEGHWVIESITTLENNETTYPKRLYYGIGRNLIELKEKQGDKNYGNYLCSKEYQDDESVIICTHFVEREEWGDNGVQPTPQQLEPYGIINPEKTIFNVIKSTRHILVLESDWARIKLKRF